jgi:(E)-4-hydroxy-3-methylbut-2-enyl-diphosphate synthase
MGHTRRATNPVRIGEITIGGGAPVSVQAMTDTATADAEATARQCRELAEAGAEIVRIAVATHDDAVSVPEIRRRVDDSGHPIPLVGDFHFNGHSLLSENPACARALDKYRINPGNVGSGRRRDVNFTSICSVARDLGKTIRIGVNGGSPDRDLLTAMLERNVRESPGLSASRVLEECSVVTALRSVEGALETGMSEDRIVVSCKVSSPRSLTRIYRRLADSTRQPLHLGLTEAGMGTRGAVRSAAAMATLLAEGIGDTLRVSLTPPPDGDRCDEVIVARELLQTLGLRSFSPTVTACPGCGRTTSSTLRELTSRVESHLDRRMPEWSRRRPGAEELRVAVMGCIVNGPGESGAADIGISLPGAGEEPVCPVHIDGERVTELRGGVDELAERFCALIDEYVASSYPPGS